MMDEAPYEVIARGDGFHVRLYKSEPPMLQIRQTDSEGIDYRIVQTTLFEVCADRPVPGLRAHVICPEDLTTVPGRGGGVHVIVE